MQSMSTGNPQVETVSTGADKAKLAVAALLAVGAVVAYYLIKQADWIRWAALIVLLIAAVATFFTAEPGKQFVAFGRDSWREVQKVVWPSRKEALQMTGYVFAFVVVMALFLWLTDKTLEWVLYDLILGWKR
jgi:preprotein translocase subunit SecE